MFREVKIGEKTVPMLAMASVDYYYKNVFGEDPIKRQVNDPGPDDMIDFIVKMGFIMAQFAERKSRKEMSKVNEEMFYEWLDQFDREDLYEMDKLTEIQDVYDGNTRTTSESKNAEDR